MTRIKPIELEAAPAAAQPSLDLVAKKLGRVPEMYRVMANSPAVLDSYVKFNAALSGGALGSKMAELIALAAAETNSCSYCLSAHTFFSKKIGLTADEIEAGKAFSSTDQKIQTGLQFAKKILKSPGAISSQDILPLREAGYSDGEVLEIIGNVIRNLYTNYVNTVSETNVDWPEVVQPKVKTNSVII